MSSEENKALVRRFYDEVVNQRKIDVLDEILADDFQGFKAEGDASYRDRVAFKHIMQGVINAFQGYHQVVNDWIAENDRVVARWITTGTHVGDYLGVPATGKLVRITGIDIFRVANGKIKEHWVEYDLLSTMQQLGAIQ